MGHFYRRDGSSCYKIPDKNGDMVDTTLRDARRLDLCPSVSTITGMMNAPGLNWWKEEQLLSAGWAMRGMKAEEFWKKSCREAASGSLMDTADRGTFIHDCMECLALGKPLPYNEYDYPEDMFQSMYEWWEEKGLEVNEVEGSFCHPMGFGGKYDLFATADGVDIVADYKSKDTAGKTLSRLLQRDTMPVQLAAYLEGIKYNLSQKMLYVTDPQLMTVIISRDEPGRIEEYIWPKKDYNGYWEEFKRRLGCWQWSKKFDTSWE